MSIESNVFYDKHALRNGKYVMVNEFGTSSELLHIHSQTSKGYLSELSVYSVRDLQY